MRIKKHPILNFEGRKELHFTFNNEPLIGYEGDTVASALVASGIKIFSQSPHLQRPRGLYCAIGNCSSCQMIVDGIPNVKTCITILKEGMRVETQKDRGHLYD
ncbi:MAG: (2Fe-2S)-binding protein [Acholeplasmataceae bacterium]|nr:(2Fe-2S)-binding protein [Acholeplasmataceae bacterium]